MSAVARARSDRRPPAEAARQAANRPAWLLDLALIVPVLLVALALRLVNLGAYSGLFDEGIRAEQLYLMAQGYRPFREIFAAQGPLLLDLYYPLFALYQHLASPPLVAVRLVVVTYSLVGLVGLYWLGRQLAGRLGGFAAAAILALSPLYLEGSRLALAEVPALAPAILALGCAVTYQRRGELRWMIAAGLLLTISLLMKPITFAAVPGVALAALLRGRRGLRDLVLVGLAMLALSALVIWLLGFSEVRDQILAYRQASRESEGWSLRKNLRALQLGLVFEPSTLVPLALLGLVALLATGCRRALAGVAWALAGVGLLLAYSPLHGKHIVVVVPGLALLAGAGLAAFGGALAGRLAGGRTLVAGGVAGALLLAYLAALAPLLGQTGQLLRVTADTDVDPAFDQYADAVAVLRALTTPDDFIVTDQPYLAFLAERRVPPELVDTAISRVRSRSLTGSKAQTLAAAYNPKVVLLWGDRLRALGPFKSWVDANYVVVKVYNRRGDTDRALYLRRDADFELARRSLSDGLTSGPGASFGGELRLLGASIDRTELAVGQGATVRMFWELTRPTAVDYHVLLELRAPDGRAADTQQESLGAGSAGTSLWEAGHWLVQSSFVLTEGQRAGTHSVVVSAYDSRARTTIPIDGAGDSRELTLGTLTVR